MIRKTFAALVAMLFSSVTFSQNVTTPMPPIAAIKPNTLAHYGDKRIAA